MMHRALVTVLALLLVVARVWSWPGDLDTTFGDHGKVKPDVSPVGVANAAVLQADGRIVAAGSTGTYDQPLHITLVRYNVDGSLDPMFGTAGQVVTTIGSAGAALAVARQPDGKLVAAGYGVVNGQQLIALARYDSVGNADSDFGASGTVATAVGTSADARGIAVQTDDSIVVVGSTATTSGGTDFALARYDTRGNLDPSFGTGGIVVTDLGGVDAAQAVALQSDGRIVVGGSSDGRFAFARYGVDGTLDSTFGSGGVVVTNFEGRLSALALASGGKILAAGTGFNGYTFRGFVLARYNADGTSDLTFGTAGSVTSHFGSGDPDAAFALAVQSDGRIVVAGRAEPGQRNGTSYFGLLRYEADGVLDRSFAPCVGATTGFGVFVGAEAVAVLVQPDGKLVAVGRYFEAARYVGTGAATACEPAVPGRSALLLRSPILPPHAVFSRPQWLRWRWTGVSAVDTTDFGDPTAGTDLILCVMDAESGVPFELGAMAPANPCVTESPARPSGRCWRSTARGYSYMAPSDPIFEVPDGLARITLRPGPAGRATIHVQGGGHADPPVLALPSFPLTTPVVVRFQRDDGPSCWEATFSNPSRNDGTGFTAKSD